MFWRLSVVVPVLSISIVLLWGGSELFISSGENTEIEISMSARISSVFVLGATGEVGKAVVQELAKHAQIEKVTLIGRRKVDLPANDENYKKFSQAIIDFDDLAKFEETFQGFDAGICALGTTRGKSGADGFYKVDHDYVVNTAKLAKAGGCKHFNLVSSAGANKNAYFLYPKVKGQVEEEITDMGFERLSIYRPSVLLCKRNESRPMEAVAQGLLNCLDRWRVLSIDVPVLARGIVNNLLKTSAPKVELVDNSAAQVLGNLNKK